MTKKRIWLTLFFAMSLFMVSPLSAEKISLKLSFSLNTFSEGDLEGWVRSLNSLWQDYSALNPGSLTGAFAAPSYGSNFELELRIPIFRGFGLNLAGGQIDGSKEGAVFYAREGVDQEQTQSVLNDVSAFNLKIGLSYRVELPFLSGLHVFANAGRNLVFAKYDVKEKWQSILRISGLEFQSAYDKEDSFSSDALGFYAGLGAEYDLVKYIAVVFEVEKVWSNVDGFKGSHYFKLYTDTATLLQEEGKATLYYYDTTPFALPDFYPTLAGHIDRPEGDMFRNIRQGELNFSRFSVKLGVRFKF